MTKVAFIGAGSWGTSVASIVTQKGEYETLLWARRPELAETINLYHENPEYLPDLHLPEQLHATNELDEALANAEVVVMAVPSHGFRAVLKEVAQIVGPAPVYVSLTKGVEIDTCKRMSEVLAEEVDGLAEANTAILTGPNLAKEIMASNEGRK